MTEVYVTKPGTYSHYLSKLANLTQRISIDGKYILYENHRVGSSLLFEALAVPRSSSHRKIGNAIAFCQLIFFPKMSHPSVANILQGAWLIRTSIVVES